MKHVQFTEDTNFDHHTSQCHQCKHRNISPMNRNFNNCILCKKEFCQSCMATVTLCLHCYLKHSISLLNIENWNSHYHFSCE